MRQATTTLAGTASTATWICGFAALIWAGAQITIPTQPVPMTLQTPFVLLAAVVLGARNGAAANALYLAAGFAGLPVFAYGGGPAYIASPTAGYLLAFPLAAFVCGSLVHRTAGPALPRCVLGMTCGLCVVFLVGTAWLKVATGLAWPNAINDGFAALQLWDAAKIGATALLAAAWLRRVESSRGSA